MGIKYSSFQNSGILNIPNKDKYISISGGWDSAPTNGGIITFNGNASIVEDKFDISFSQGLILQETINLGVDIGTFYITSISRDEYLGYTKTAVSFSCILGLLSKSKMSVPLGACIYIDSDINDVIKSLNKITGLTVALPVATTGGQPLKLHEPVWIKENQSVISLLNEILTANGCILYSMDGKSTVCKSINNFFAGLSGNSNGNTINKNFVIDRGSAGIKFVDISGTKSITQKLPGIETITVGQKTTVIERTLPEISKGGERKIVTTITDLDQKTKNVITEKFEKAPPYKGGKLNPNVPIKDCYPEDPARIISRVTEIYWSKSKYESMAKSCVREFTNSCNAEKEPIAIMSFPDFVIIEKITEKWSYDTADGEIVTNPNTYVPPRETIKYTKEILRIPAYENLSNCNLTYGNTFEFLADPDDALKIRDQFFQKKAVKAYQSLVLMETEEINWEKKVGSYRWGGNRIKKEAFIRTRFEERKTFMKELKRAIEGGYEDFDLITSNYVVSPFSILNVNISEWDFNTFKTNFSSFQSAIESSIYNLEITEDETRMDWEPEYTTAPTSYKVYNIPWMDRVSSLGSLPLPSKIPGETISISAGRFNDYNSLKSVATEVIKANNKRKKSLSVTNINELFKVGEIDAPSFNIDVNGVKSSGVYLNG